MSLERKVGRAVLDLCDLVKTQAVSAISAARKEGNISLSNSEMSEMSKVLDASIEKTFQNGLDGVLRLLKDVKN